jgi:hypothetical protein
MCSQGREHVAELRGATEASLHSASSKHGRKGAGHHGGGGQKTVLTQKAGFGLGALGRFVHLGWESGRAQQGWGWR